MTETPAATPLERYASSPVPESDCGRNWGSLAMFAAIRRPILRQHVDFVPRLVRLRSICDAALFQ